MKFIELIWQTPLFFLFVLNVVEVIYFVNYQCCRHFHRNPVLAPTSKLSFGALSSGFTFLSGNQRPRDRTGEMDWMGNIINQTRRSLWHVDWEHPPMFPLPTLPCQITECPKHRRAVLLGLFQCWFNSRSAVWVRFASWNWSGDPGPEVSDWERWMGLHFGAYIDGQVGTLVGHGKLPCFSHLKGGVSRELYPKNSRRDFDPFFGERALYPREERAIASFWLSLVPGEQHIFYLQTRLGQLPALSLALWAPYWGFAMVSVGFPASTFSHNTTPISTLHSESSDRSHSPALIEIVGYVPGTGLDLSCPCSQTLILSPVINPYLRLSAGFLVTPTFPLRVGHWAILPPATINFDSTTRLHKINNVLFGTIHILIVQKYILL